MKETTRILKEEARQDKVKIYSHNNHKEEMRSAEQIEQSRNDKRMFYQNKWTEKLKGAETKAQKEICKDVLNRLQILDNNRKG